MQMVEVNIKLNPDEVILLERILIDKDKEEALQFP